MENQSSKFRMKNLVEMNDGVGGTYTPIAKLNVRLQC